MEKKIKDFVKNNLEEISNFFPDKVILKLKELKKNENLEFEEYLELVFELDDKILHKVEQKYLEKNDSTEIAIQELTKKLDDSLYKELLPDDEYLQKAESIISTSTKKTLSLAGLCESLSDIYTIKANFKKALKYQEIALEISETLLDKEDQQLAQIYNNTAIVYSGQGMVLKAIEYMMKSLEINKLILEENNPELASNYNNISIMYREVGRIQEALEYQKKALEIDKKFYGENHLVLSGDYCNLAIIYHTLGDLEKALEYQKKDLNIKESFKKENLDLATSYYNIAITYNSLKMYQKALLSLNKAIMIKKNILPDNHPEIANNYYTLSDVYFNMEKYDLALENILKSISIRESLNSNLNWLDLIRNFNLASLIHNKLNNKIKYREYKEKTKYIFNKVIKSLIEEDIDNEYLVDTYKKYKNLFDQSNFINSEMGLNTYIDKVKIENFKLLEDFEIELNNRVNIIIGENSSGKTSFLQAITLGLVESKYSIGEGLNPYSKYITHGKDKSIISINMGRFKKTIEVFSNEKKVKNDILSPFVLSYSSNIFTEYGDLSKLIPELENETISEDFVSSIFKDYSNKLYNPKAVLMELYKIGSEKANIFVETINYFLEDFKLELNDKNEYIFKHYDKREFKLENLSEGYRNNILLIGDILIRVLGIGKTPDTIEGVILIDEFDRHLHPKWQSSVVSKLKTYFPKIQFILTTHNPMSTLDREADEIIVIKEVKGKLEAVKGKGTKNIDVGTVLLKYFGVDSLVGISMQNSIIRFTELKVKDELTNEEQNEYNILEKKLDETVATNFIYNNSYFKFLKFLKNHKNIEFNSLDDLEDDELDQLLMDFEKSL